MRSYPQISPIHVRGGAPARRESRNPTISNRQLIINRFSPPPPPRNLRSARIISFRVSCSSGQAGYNYPEWKGSFYPSDLPATKMLPYYASKFPTVEINYTFYRMPTPKLIAGWRAQVPPEFRFTLKGAQAHHARQAAAPGRRHRVRERIHHRRVRSSARRWRRCCFSCRRTSRKTLAC